MKAKPFYQLGDDDNPWKKKTTLKDMLIIAAIMLMIWIPIGFFIFQWNK